MRERRLSLTAALVMLGALAFAASAPACSCAPMKPNEALRQSDAAIVARLVKVVPRGTQRAIYRYEVQRVYRGRHSVERDKMLSVRSARRAAACALPRRIGHRYGLFLTRADGRWSSGICGVIAPRKLEEAAKRPGRRAGGGARTSAGSTCSQGGP
jgi:Tissue inhibitor of metalloproteinase